MREYIVNSEANRKLNSLDIGDRLKNTDEFLDTSGLISSDEIVSLAMEAKEEGFFDKISKEEMKNFQTKMNDALKNIDSPYWTCKDKNSKSYEPASIEDLLVFSGGPAFFVLDNEELSQYREFGFGSLIDFMGTIGAIAFEENKFDFGKGYKWDSEHADGKVYENEVTGDMNGDLRVHQKDITNYEVINPFGEESSFRPVFESGPKGIMAYHSTEVPFLVHLIKYSEQIGLNPEVFKDEGKGLVERILSEEQREGNAETSIPFGGDNMFSHFVRYYKKIPELDGNYEANEKSPDFLPTAGGPPYCAYVGPNEELIYSFEQNMESSQKSVSAVFQPSDVDHLVEGLVYQSINGQGRTPASQIAKAIDYKFSGKFDKKYNELMDK